MGVVVLRRYIDLLTIIINFPYSTCISWFFWQQHPNFFVHFLNVFFGHYNDECNPQHTTIIHTKKMSKH